MSVVIRPGKVVEVMLPKSGHIVGQMVPDVHVCVMALDLAFQAGATEIRVHAPNETHPRVYSVEQVKQYLWNHPALQVLKGLGTVGPGPGRANFGTGQHIISDMKTRNGIPIPHRMALRMRKKQQQSYLAESA